MSFAVSADAYGQFMGRFSEPLAGQFAAFLRLAPGQRALDVGCGPGALTAVLAAEIGAERVSAVDPSESFVAAARDRLPGVDVRSGAAEALPWPDGSFDCVAAQLVVHFGPAGGYLASLDDKRRLAVRDACARQFPAAPFTLAVRSWAARGRVPLP